MMEGQQAVTVDKVIAQNMRTTNYEQFKSLVRMHLSFELDLNTDEFDLPCHEVIYYEKGKVKKWNRLSKKIKGCTAGPKTNSPPDTNSVLLNMELVRQLRTLKEFLMQEENIVQEGIFRRTGAVSRQNELRLQMNQKKELNLSEGFTVHDCATVYKGCLSELAEPLLTDAHYPAHCQIADLCNAEEKINSQIKEEHLLRSVQLLMLLLPEENRILFEDIIDMLHETTKYESTNKMTPDSLATLFTPHLICPRNLPAEALHYVSQSMSSVISYMIVQGSHIFDIPPKLATDIRAYSLEQKRKKTMSPEQLLDESTSDISTVNTVYTFVDREKTAEAHNSNPTDTALAQLYAHIQSLPESSKKRKLIKQFNKENGQGTPLQFLMLNRIKHAGSSRSAKSIGDSIKKHIFHRSIMSRTPKSTSAASQCDTPNSVISLPKVRVLFQSPNRKPNTFGSSLALKKHPLHKSISSTSLLTTASTPSKLLRVDWDSRKNLAHSMGASNNLEKPTSEETGKSIELSRQDSMLHKRHSDSKHNTGIDKYQTTAVRKLLFKCKSEPDIVHLSRRGTSECPIVYENGLRKSLSLNDLKACSSCEMLPMSNTTSLGLKGKVSDSNEIHTPPRHPHDLVSHMETEDIHTPGGLNIYRSKELITSTPSLLLGRRSMSPITKSTQRMPKSMQESIMTPRSRKPVMLATTVGLLDQNQATYQGDLSSFREQDEDSFLIHNASTQVEHPALYRSFHENDLPTNINNEKVELEPDCDSLTDTFREYLLGRSVLTTNPIDASFSSHSDDFGSTPDIRDLDESEMSASLLYCLNGNQPDSSLSDFTTDNELESNSLRIIEGGCKDSFSRKRLACSEESLDEKENVYMNGIRSEQTKKVLVLEKNPNETSL